MGRAEHTVCTHTHICRTNSPCPDPTGYYSGYERKRESSVQGVYSVRSRSSCRWKVLGGGVCHACGPFVGRLQAKIESLLPPLPFQTKFPFEIRRRKSETRRGRQTLSAPELNCVVCKCGSDFLNISEQWSVRLTTVRPQMTGPSRREKRPVRNLGPSPFETLSHRTK